MTVRELIAKLQTFDPDAEVVIQDSEEIMTTHEIESFGYVPTQHGKTLAINAEYFEHSRPPYSEPDPV